MRDTGRNIHGYTTFEVETERTNVPHFKMCMVISDTTNNPLKKGQSIILNMSLSHDTLYGYGYGSYQFDIVKTSELDKTMSVLGTEEGDSVFGSLFRIPTTSQFELEKVERGANVMKRVNADTEAFEEVLRDSPRFKGFDGDIVKALNVGLDALKEQFSHGKDTYISGFSDVLMSFERHDPHTSVDVEF